jgi:methylmalonyl-CoA mutase C-terminal domain/subunit
MSLVAMNVPPPGKLKNQIRRIVLAKVGLDGHDRGIKVVARALRDAGFEVIYPGLWLSPESVVRVVAEEDAGWLGISILSGAHLVLVPRVLELLRQQGLTHVRVVVGGTIPEEDVPALLACGVAKVFGPGSALADIVQYFQSECDHERN